MTRVKRFGPVLALFGALALPGAAGAQTAAEVVAKSQEAKFLPALCPIKLEDPKAKDGQAALQKAVNEKDAAKRETGMAEAGKLLADAASHAREKDGGTWYYLGRYYLYRGDVAGADTAFARAQASLPACADDITGYRQNTWVALVNPAIEASNAGKNEEALAFLTPANQIFRGLPQGLQQTAVIYANQAKYDSSAKYLELAIAATPEDTAYRESKKQLAQYLGEMYLQLKQYPEAVKLYEGYLAANPGEVNAKRRLAVAYRETGQADKAKAIEADVLGGNQDSVTVADLFNVGVGYFNDKNYAEAAKAFQKVLEREPGNRDAMFNAVNAYFAMKDAPNQLAMAEKLAAIDPLNDQGQKLLADGQQKSGKQDLAIKTIEALEAMPALIEVGQWGPGEKGARLNALARGRQPKKLDGSDLKAAPFAVVWEFLDAKGAVVASKETEVPVVAPDQTHAIQVVVEGPGIVSWRYRKK